MCCSIAVKVLADDYTLLAPLPDLESVPNSTEALQKYIPYVFKLAIGISAAFTVGVIIYGGIEYMVAESLVSKNNGKNRIKNAILGLVFVITAWLILNTINPDFTTINLSIEPAVIAQPIGTLTAPGYKMTSEQLAESNKTRQDLNEKGISTYRSPCEGGETTGCVNLNGLSSATLDGLEKLGKALGCSETNSCMTITAGTEGGHSATGAHPTGNAVDFAFSQTNNKNVTNFLVEQLSKGKATSQMTKDGELITTTIDGSTITFLEEGDHWHVEFK